MDESKAHVIIRRPGLAVCQANVIRLHTTSSSCPSCLCHVRFSQADLVSPELSKWGRAATDRGDAAGGRLVQGPSTSAGRAAVPAAVAPASVPLPPCRWLQVTLPPTASVLRVCAYCLVLTGCNCAAGAGGELRRASAASRLVVRRRCQEEEQQQQQEEEERSNGGGGDGEQEQRTFLSLEEAGLVEMSGLSTHERFLCRLTVSVHLY